VVPPIPGRRPSSTTRATAPVRGRSLGQSPGADHTPRATQQPEPLPGRSLGQSPGADHTPRARYVSSRRASLDPPPAALSAMCAPRGTTAAYARPWCNHVTGRPAARGRHLWWRWWMWPSRAGSRAAPSEVAMAASSEVAMAASPEVAMPPSPEVAMPPSSEVAIFGWLRRTAGQGRPDVVRRRGSRVLRSVERVWLEPFILGSPRRSARSAHRWRSCRPGRSPCARSGR